MASGPYRYCGLYEPLFRLAYYCFSKMSHFLDYGRFLFFNKVSDRACFFFYPLDKKT